MPDEYWLDYSVAKLSGDAIRRAGFTGVIRYIDEPTRLSTKHTNPAEYASHREAGLDVLLVMQVNTLDADLGFSGGQTRIRRARAGAKYIGYPDEKPIFLTNDRTTVPDPAKWRAYLDGGASVQGRENTGAYGFGNAMDLAIGHADWFWQAGRKSEMRKHAHLWQDNNFQPIVAGIETDRNLILRPEIKGAPMTEAEMDILVTKVIEAIKFRILATPHDGPHKWTFDGRNIIDFLTHILWRGETLAQNDAVQTSALTALSDDEAKILTAMRETAGGAIDPDGLADAIAARLPEGVTAAMVADALRMVFLDAGTPPTA